LRSLKERRAFSGHGGGSIIGAEAMSLSVLKVVLWIFGIRGHIPQNDDFGDGRSGSSFAANCGPLTRVLAAFIVVVGLLSLVVWAAVWLAIKLL
jgi:hypothetical protein